MHKLISTDLDKEMNDMIKKIDESFGITLTKVQSSKVVAWKSRNHKAQLTEKQLIQIMGDRL